MIKSTVVHKEKDSIGDLKKVEVHSDELLQKDTEKIGRRQDGYGVHPVTYNIYKFTQVTMRFFYVFSQVRPYVGFQTLRIFHHLRNFLTISIYFSKLKPFDPFVFVLF